MSYSRLTDHRLLFLNTNSFLYVNHLLPRLRWLRIILGQLILTHLVWLDFIRVLRSKLILSQQRKGVVFICWGLSSLHLLDLLLMLYLALFDLFLLGSVVVYILHSTLFT